MTEEHNRSDGSHPRDISRRKFIKLAAMAGLLAGCRPSEKPVTPTARPAPTPTPAPTPMPLPPRPEIIKFYPDVPSKVVHTHHAGVRDGDALVPEAIREMLDASITALTSLKDASEAWAALFDPSERIAIKVNTIPYSIGTQIPLVMAVTECLQEVGVPAEQIVIFDRATSDLKGKRYPVNEDGPGVRCYGNGANYTAGWVIGDVDVRLSDILLNCDALINVPLLKRGSISGISFAMKNHFGSFHPPSHFHGRLSHAIPALNDLPPIRDRARLIIGDALTVDGVAFQEDKDSILLSFDPVAHDTVGLQMLVELMSELGRDPAAPTRLANRWLENGAELGLGTNDPDSMDLVEVSLG